MTMITAFFTPPLLLTSSFSDSRGVVPQTCGSLSVLCGGNFGMAPERVIVPDIPPPSVTVVTSYWPGAPAGALAAGADGAAGGSCVVCSCWRPQLTRIVSMIG